jgi:hypothetical protein
LPASSVTLPLLLLLLLLLLLRVAVLLAAELEGNVLAGLLLSCRCFE